MCCQKGPSLQTSSRLQRQEKLQTAPSGAGVLPPLPRPSTPPLLQSRISGKKKKHKKTSHYKNTFLRGVGGLKEKKNHNSRLGKATTLKTQERKVGENQIKKKKKRVREEKKNVPKLLNSLELHQNLHRLFFFVFPISFCVTTEKHLLSPSTLLTTTTTINPQTPPYHHHWSPRLFFPPKEPKLCKQLKRA